MQKKTAKSSVNSVGAALASFVRPTTTHHHISSCLANRTTKGSKCMCTENALTKLSCVAIKINTTLGEVL